MSQVLVADLEAKIKDLNDKINQQAGYYSQINEAIKKLRADRKTVQGQVSEMRGAVQAFNGGSTLSYVSIAKVNGNNKFMVLYEDTADSNKGNSSVFLARQFSRW